MRECDRSLDPVAGGPLEPAAGFAGPFASRLVAVMARPSLIGAADVAACRAALSDLRASSAAYDGALDLLAAVVYWRPDLVGSGVVEGLERRFLGPARIEAVYRRAAELLRCLLVTPAGPEAVRSVLRLLARPDLEDAAYDTLLDVIEHATSWAAHLLDLGALLAVAAQTRLARHHARLLHTIVEPVLFADPRAVSAPLAERLIEIFRDQPGLHYVLYYLAAHTGLAPLVRQRAAAAIQGEFPLHGQIAVRLGTGDVTVLLVQNIADRQGDEIIRVVHLLESLLACNPRLEVVLITDRQYLYGHSRLTLVPIDDEAGVEAVLRDRFDAVINCYDARVPESNYSRRLEDQVRANVRAYPPFLYVATDKGWNHFVYQRVDVAGRPYAEALGLDRRRLPNVYETTLRLIAELGWPLRLGEEPPATDSVIASLPSPPAEAAWSALIEPNGQGRPVALLCPFGGGEPLKGYVERQSEAVAEQIRGLIEQGFYVVVLPNGMPWGSARQAREVVNRLALSEQRHVIVAPDPADAAGTVTYRHAGTQTVPGPSYQMRLVTYFVRFADLIVAVEGWMIHAAYALGKPFRSLMLPYSHPAVWRPYARTLRQGFTLPTGAPLCAATAGAPLPEQPRKFALLAILRRLGASGAARAPEVLRWALRSEDRDLRLAATASLGCFSGPEIDAALQDRLADPAAPVRAAAAEALLGRPADGAADGGALHREALQAHVLIGRDARDWLDVLRLGERARPALTMALHDEDEVIRREAAPMLAALGQRLVTTVARRAPAAPRRAGPALGQMVSVGEQGAPGRFGCLRRLGRRLSRRDQGTTAPPNVLILTPVKDAADCLNDYFQRLRRLAYPHHLLSVGLLESDSTDSTFRELRRHARAHRQAFRRVGVWKQDFGYRIPPGVPRWSPAIQVARRRVLALSRNHLLFRALDDEAWVLWLDVDVVEYPPDLIERLLRAGRDIVQPHCVLDYGGPTFDCNGWRDHGRLHLDDLRGEGELVELEAVGGTVLLVRADLHRAGLVFPPFLYGTANPGVRTGARQHNDGRPVAGEIETEGLGMLARDMGYRCWGMPHFEVLHRRR